MEELLTSVIGEGGISRFEIVVTVRGSEEAVKSPKEEAFIAITTMLYDVSLVNPSKVAVDVTPSSAEGITSVPFNLYL